MFPVARWVLGCLTVGGAMLMMPACTPIDTSQDSSQPDGTYQTQSSGQYQNPNYSNPSYPNQPYPGQTYPGQTYPGQTYPGEYANGQNPQNPPVFNNSLDPDPAPIQQAPPQFAVATQHLSEAQTMVERVDPTRNAYDPRNGILRWKPNDSHYECRCTAAGFVTLLLEHCYGTTKQDFDKWMGTRQPTAVTYHDAIVDGHAFLAVNRIRDIQGGDILAVKYPAGVRASEPGHMMIANGQAQQRTATAPIIPGTEQFELSIIDCAETGHGVADTRHLANGSFQSGVGRGTLRLYADRHGRIVGYAWTLGPKAAFLSRPSYDLAVGRLIVAVK